MRSAPIQLVAGPPAGKVDCPFKAHGIRDVFYEALGHSERIYAMRPMLEHLVAGMQ